jgi:alkylation response protein AidB-like acyl-CoA dehydrogenase
MNLELDDEQVALRDTVRRYLAEKASVATYVRPLLDDTVTGGDDVWRGLAAMGVTGLLVPESCGGAGMTMVEAGVVAEELGAALYPGPWLSSAVAGARALMHTGADKNAAELLTGIAAGSTVATVGPLSGPRPTTIDGATLRGTVTGLPDAAAAAVILVFADERDGVGLYSVDTSSPGVAVTPCAHIDPTRKRSDVEFDGAPAQRLASASMEDISAVADDVIIAYAADALGAAAAVMTLAVEYAKVRKQFDQPIGSFQAVQHLCVDMYEATELARSGVIHALWAADAAEPAERHLAALRAKAFAGRLTSVGDTAIQVFGGIGFTWEHDAHLYLKRLLGWSGFLGAPDRYLEAVGKGLS